MINRLANQNIQLRPATKGLNFAGHWVNPKNLPPDVFSRFKLNLEELTGFVKTTLDKLDKDYPDIKSWGHSYLAYRVSILNLKHPLEKLRAKVDTHYREANTIIIQRGYLQLMVDKDISPAAILAIHEAFAKYPEIKVVLVYPEFVYDPAFVGDPNYPDGKRPQYTLDSSSLEADFTQYARAKARELGLPVPNELQVIDADAPTEDTAPKQLPPG